MWSNPNAANGMTTATANLSDSLANYEHFSIDYFDTYYGSSDHSGDYNRKTQLFKVPNCTEYALDFTSTWLSSDKPVFIIVSRPFQKTSNTQITFSNALEYRNSNGTISCVNVNNSLIPIAIYGYKY